MTNEPANELRRIAETLDVAAARRAFNELFPQFQSAPERDEDMLFVLHHARTQMRSVAFRLRAYSHCWLSERKMPSALPDHLRRAAERIYPRVVEGVGVAMLRRDGDLSKFQRGVMGKMSDKVAEVYADMPEGRNPDPVVVRAQMLDARTKAHKYYRDLLQSIR